MIKLVEVKEFKKVISNYLGISFKIINNTNIDKLFIQIEINKENTPSNIEIKSQIKDGNWDTTLDKIQLIMFIEEIYNIIINDDESDDIITIKDLYNKINQKLK